MYRQHFVHRHIHTHERDEFLHGRAAVCFLNCLVVDWSCFSRCDEMNMCAEIDLEDGPAHESARVQVHPDLAGMSSLYRRRKNTRMVGVCGLNGLVGCCAIRAVL